MLLPRTTSLEECATACCAASVAKPGSCGTWLLFGGGCWGGAAPCKGPAAPGSMGASVFSTSEGQLNGMQAYARPLQARANESAACAVRARPLPNDASRSAAFPHTDGAVLQVALFNPDLRGPEDIRVAFVDLQKAIGTAHCRFDLARPVGVRDLWEHQSLGEFRDGVTARAVPEHGLRLLRLSQPAPVLRQALPGT